MTLAQRAAQLWPHSAAYQAKWLRSVTLLGEKWVYAVPIKKGQ